VADWLLRDEYFAFALSFLVIAVFWMSHHRWMVLPFLAAESRRAIRRLRQN
jgi:uncharacterized membrane protein